jgi:hypothetical protein
MRTRAFLAVPFLLALSAPAFATVMVLPVKGTNLDQGADDAIGQMFANAYQAEAKDRTIGPADAQKAVDENGGYSQAAQKLGASEYVFVTAIRLDARISITATRYGADGHYIYSAKMSAATLDDVEPASDRLVKALIHEKPPVDERDLDNVTRAEQTQPLRVTSQKVAGFKGSFIYPVGWSETVAPQMSGAFDLRLENGMHFIEFGLGLTFAAPNHHFGYGGIWLDIGGDIYLTNGSTAPYLGIGVMPRLMGESSPTWRPTPRPGSCSSVSLRLAFIPTFAWRRTSCLSSTMTCHRRTSIRRS